MTNTAKIVRKPPHNDSRQLEWVYLQNLFSIVILLKILNMQPMWLNIILRTLFEEKKLQLMGFQSGFTGVTGGTQVIFAGVSIIIISSSQFLDIFYPATSLRTKGDEIIFREFPSRDYIASKQAFVFSDIALAPRNIYTYGWLYKTL